MAKSFRSSKDLIAALKKEGNKVLTQTSQYSKNQNSVLDKELIDAAKELRQVIMDNYRISHKKVSGKSASAKRLIGSPEISENKMTVTMHFTDAGYRRNMFDQWDSFVPVLLDYGWSVKGSQNPNNIFMHYEGDRYIRRAIENFNNKYRAKGIYATFEIDGQDYTEFSESNKIPYKIND